MENLPTEKQSVTSFTLPSKKPDRLKFFLFLGLGLVLLVLIGEGVYWLKLRKEKEQVTPQLPQESQVESFLPKSASPHPTGAFEAPVKEESIAKGKAIQFDSNANDWAVFLPEGELIYAAFSGQAEWAGENDPQKIIILTSEDGGLVWKYFFVGKPLIKNGQRVEKGEVIAKLGSEPLPTYDVNLIIQALWEGKRVNLDL